MTRETEVRRVKGKVRWKVAGGLQHDGEGNESGGMEEMDK